MKTKIYLLLLILFIQAGCQEVKESAPDTFTVSGTLEGLDTDFMIRSYRDEDGNRVSDSIKVVDNSFTYTAKITEPTFIFFWPYVERTIKRSGRGYYPVKSSQLAFLASPGDDIIFEGEVTDFINAYPGGTEANDDLARINSEIFPLMNQAINMQLRMNLIEDSLEAQPLVDSIEFLDKRVIELKKEFVKNNATSEAAMWYLSDMMMRSHVTQEEAIELFEDRGANLTEYPYYKEVATRVNGIKSTKVGMIMPDFTTLDALDSSDFTLSSLRGKYVLIDFWGTWCGPCIAEMPTVKEYQNKYNETLTVLGVNSGDSPSKMREYVIENNFDWPQVLAKSDEMDLVLRFNVQGFPTKIILDPEGRILHRFLGETEKSFAVLDSLLTSRP